jgi:phage gpG-like protein
MAGFSGVSGDFDRMQRVLNAMQRLRSTWNTDLAKVLASTSRAEVMHQFAESRDPYGRPWTALAESTIRGRRTGRRSKGFIGPLAGPKILIDTARLRNSFSFTGMAGAIHIGTNVVYAGVHQYGHTFPARSSAAPRSLNFGRGGRFSRPSKAFKSMRVHQTFGAHTVPQRQMIPEGGNPGRWRAAFERDTRTWVKKTFEGMAR